MPSTYTLISSNVLTSSAASVTFSSIPSTYTDLVIRCSTRSDVSGAILVELNGDSSTIYSTTRLRGDGSTASSGRTSSAANLYFGLNTPSTATANTFTSQEIYIPNYTVSQNRVSSNFQVAENNSATTSVYIDLQAGLYTSTTAITQIKFLHGSANNYAAGSSFYLYGIKNS